MDDPQTDGPEQGPDLTTLAAVEHELAAVERALQRLDDGAYGTCEACGDTIADQVLETSPATLFCGAHQPPG